MRISIIAAVAENGVIGRGGRLPWHLADDLKRFKRLTMGHTVVMGRKTWQSVGRPLPGRRMVVISRQAGYQAEGIDVVSNFDAALEIAAAAGDDEAFIIGGAQIYRLALPRADGLYLTRVHAIVEGDSRFPEIGPSGWQLLESERREASQQNDYPFTFERYERV